MVKPNIRAASLVGKFESIYEEPEDESGKKDLLVTLIRLFSSLASRPEFLGEYPDFAALLSKLERDLDHKEAEAAEVSLTQMYCYLHGHEKSYSTEERRDFEEYGGYWCHAGGLSPIYRARPFITRETRLADYGAGNGLQGLLFQYLYPHAKTSQIELSQAMIHRGGRLQAFMGIPEDRVEWLHKNIVEVPPSHFDFIYIYRPLRPDGKGRGFYEAFARVLDGVGHRVVIFSIADCLRDFLSPRFRVFHDDGHLTCFTNRVDDS